MGVWDEPLGDCYEAAADYVMKNAAGIMFGSKKGLVLVHAEVMHQRNFHGYGHAWVEDGGTVIDQSNGRDIRMPKSKYYELGGVDTFNNMHRYTSEQMRRQLLKHEHYGPWDLKTSTGV